jgi:hypothetical protein
MCLAAWHAGCHALLNSSFDFILNTFVFNGIGPLFTSRKTAQASKTMKKVLLNIWINL